MSQNMDSVCRKELLLSIHFYWHWSAPFHLLQPLSLVSEKKRLFIVPMSPQRKFPPPFTPQLFIDCKEEKKGQLRDADAEMRSSYSSGIYSRRRKDRLLTRQWLQWGIPRLKGKKADIALKNRTLALTPMQLHICIHQLHLFSHYWITNSIVQFFETPNQLRAV